MGRDQIADKRYEDETAYNRETYKDETEYNRALAKAQTLAAGGDFSGYKALGYTDQEIAGLKSTYNKAQASVRSGGGPENSGSDAQIGNRHGDSWIYIPGHGRFTYDEVENYVNSGKVIETYDSATNTYTYKWNGNKK